MQIIIISLCLFSAIFAYKSNKTSYNPITVFCILWASIVFLSSLTLFGIYEASDKTYIIILVGIISFLFGNSVLGGFKFKVSMNPSIQKNIFTLNKKVIYILMVISIAILSFTASKSVKLLLSGYDLAYVRYIANEEVTTSSNGLINILFNYVAQPICQLLIPVSALNIFSKDKDKKLIIGSVIAITLLVISNGGRFILLYFIIHFVFIGTFVRGHFHINKKIQNRVRVILIATILAIVYITVSRGSLIGKTLYTYTSGCVPHMSLRVSSFDSYGEYTYGFSSFQGFLRPIFTLFRQIGLINHLPELIQRAEELAFQVEAPISIGGDFKYNAFVSLFYYFYIDFNMLGVVIISIFYGYLCKLAYNNMMRKNSNTSIVIYSLLLQSIITSMFRFQFATFIFSLTFIYLVLIKGKHVYISKKV